MKRLGLRTVGELLPEAVPALRERLLERQIREAWPALVGADVARRSRPRGVTNGCLHVVVDSSAWLQELTLRSRELTARIAAREPAIRTLRLSLGRLDAGTESAVASAARPARVLGSDEIDAIEARVAPIQDPSVQDAARRLLGTAWRAGLPRGDA